MNADTYIARLTAGAALARFYGLCISLTYDGIAVACRRVGGQLLTVIPWPVGARTEDPFTLDGPAANGGAV